MNQNYIHIIIITWTYIKGNDHPGRVISGEFDFGTEESIIVVLG